MLLQKVMGYTSPKLPLTSTFSHFCIKSEGIYIQIRYLPELLAFWSHSSVSSRLGFVSCVAILAKHFKWRWMRCENSVAERVNVKYIFYTFDLLQGHLKIIKVYNTQNSRNLSKILCILLINAG